MAFLGLIADVSLYLQFVSFMLLKHSIVTVARSSRKRKEKWFIFVLEMIVAEHNGTNIFIKSKSASYLHTYSKVPNNSAARLLIIEIFSYQHGLIWTYTIIYGSD